MLLSVLVMHRTDHHCTRDLKISWQRLDLYERKHRHPLTWHQETLEKPFSRTNLVWRHALDKQFLEHLFLPLRFVE